jgi:hypothetical protein
MKMVHLYPYTKQCIYIIIVEKNIRNATYKSNVMFIVLVIALASTRKRNTPEHMGIEIWWKIIDNNMLYIHYYLFAFAHLNVLQSWWRFRTFKANVFC